MYNVARSAWVMHSAADMYSLVNDIESYSEFLPWCGASKVLEQSELQMVAQLQVAFRGVRKSFTTCNRLTPFEKTTMTLLEGPFSELYGTWEFKSLRADACKISLSMQFDFSNAVTGTVVAPVFKYIANSMVESFVKRAAQVHAG